MKEVFENIIRGRTIWGPVPCGAGSTEEYTKSLRQTLVSFVQRHNFQSMLDAPCGDYSWMKMLEFPPGFRYQGADIVEFMIEQNKQQHPEVEFCVMDITQDPLPAVDVMLCRDCLFHFSHSDVFKFLHNIAGGQIKYLLTTSYLDNHADNRDINTGEFRQLSLTRPPYNLPAPVDTIDDWIPGYAKRGLMLWSVETVRQALLGHL